MIPDSRRTKRRRGKALNYIKSIAYRQFAGRPESKRPRARRGRRPPQSPAVNLFRALATVSSFTLLSRVTGLARDMLISRLFGASAETDAFNVAFRLPNLLRRLFGEGAFQQAFVPMLADVKARGDEATTVSFAGHVASALFWTLLLVSVAGVVAAPVLVWLIASGLARNPAAFELASVMTRWMFPYILFMSLVAMAAGVLNTYKRFAVPAFTPVLLNLSFIACALWLAPRLERPIMALAFAVLIGGMLQLGLQWAALRRAGLRMRIGSPRAAFADPDVRRVAGLMLPAIFSVSVAQLSIIINTNIASHLTTGSVTWLAFADRLMEFPTALLGVALGTVLLPSLSSAFAEKRLQDYSRLLDWGLRLIFLLALPAAIGLGLLAEGIVSVLFQGREFTAVDVHQTAVAVIGYAVGLIGLDCGEDPCAGFLCAEGRPHSGQDRCRRAGGNPVGQPGAGAAVCARRSRAVGQPGGLRQCAGTFHRPETARRLCTSRRLARVSDAPRGRADYLGPRCSGSFSSRSNGPRCNPRPGCALACWAR